MCYFLGLTIGGVTFGLVADRYGRRKALIFSIIMSSFTSLMGAAMSTYWSYLMMRFLSGIATEGILMSAFMIAIEVVGMEYLTRCGVLVQVSVHYSLPSRWSPLIPTEIKLRINIQSSKHFLRRYYFHHELLAFDLFKKSEAIKGK